MLMHEVRTIRPARANSTHDPFPQSLVALPATIMTPTIRTFKASPDAASFLGAALTLTGVIRPMAPGRRLPDCDVGFTLRFPSGPNVRQCLRRFQPQVECGFAGAALCSDPGLENLMEHRLGHRVPTREEIFVRVGEATAVSAVLADMSVSGAFVRAESQPALFSTVWVRWHEGEGSASPQPVVSAQVVRQSSDGFGIEWAEFAPRAVCMRLNRHWLRESCQRLRQSAETITR
jgi:hypothetical protein